MSPARHLGCKVCGKRFLFTEANAPEYVWELLRLHMEDKHPNEFEQIQGWLDGDGS